MSTIIDKALADSLSKKVKAVISDEEMTKMAKRLAPKLMANLEKQFLEMATKKSWVVEEVFSDLLNNKEVFNTFKTKFIEQLTK